MALEVDGVALEKGTEESPPVTRSQETEKLLAGGVVVSASFSDQGLVADGEAAERNGQPHHHHHHSVPYKACSEGTLEGKSLSPSKLSLGRASSTATTSNLHEAGRPKDYLFLAIFSCFCPIWPVNILALIFSILSRNSTQQGDLDGARRLGRLARFLSILSIVLGSVILVIIVLNFLGLLTPN